MDSSDEESSASVQLINEEEQNVVTETEAEIEEENAADFHIMAVNLAVVFEEMCDRLEVLTGGIDANRPELRTLGSIEYDSEINRPKMLHADGWVMAQHYESRLHRRIQQIGKGIPEKSVQLALEEANLKGKTEQQKIQADRAYVEDIGQRVMKDLIQGSTYSTLVDEVIAGRTEQRKLAKLTERVHEQVQRKKALKQEIKNTVMSKAAEMAILHSKISQMEDEQYQLKERTTLENSYNDKYSAMLKRKTHRFYAVPSYKQYLKTLELKRRMTLEDNAHENFANFISIKHKEAQELLDFWLNKYESDKDVLTAELDALKEERARCLERIAFIQNYIHIYKPIVDDDKRIKKIEEDKVKLLELQHKKATRIQAVWRGYMVRKGLLWFDPRILFGKDDEKNGKGKKGKGKGKGKGKKGKKK